MHPCLGSRAGVINVSAPTSLQHFRHFWPRGESEARQKKSTGVAPGPGAAVVVVVVVVVAVVVAAVVAAVVVVYYYYYYYYQYFAAGGGRSGVRVYKVLPLLLFLSFVVSLAPLLLFFTFVPSHFLSNFCEILRAFSF